MKRRRKIYSFFPLRVGRRGEIRRRWFLNVSWQTRRFSNELSLVSVVGAVQLVHNYKVSLRQVLPRDLSSLLRDLFTARRALAFLPSSSRSQKSNIKRDRPERASPSPLASFRRGSREYFAMLIAKWTHYFSCTNARECVYSLFPARYWLCVISVIILIIASWERIMRISFCVRKTYENQYILIKLYVIWRFVVYVHNVVNLNLLEIFFGRSIM